MTKQSFRWFVAWVILIAAVVIVFFMRGMVNVGELGSLLLFAIGAITLVVVRPILKRFPTDRRLAAYQGKGSAKFNLLVPGGIFSIIAAFAWLYLTYRLVPNTQAGALMLFLPSIGLLFLGVAALAVRVYAWFFG